MTLYYLDMELLLFYRLLCILHFVRDSDMHAPAGFRSKRSPEHSDMHAPAGFRSKRSPEHSWSC